jgi:hypothetical protein
MQLQDTTLAGNIQVRPGERGVEFHSWNHQRERMLHVGTLSGVTYEKQAQILQRPEPSFALCESELHAIEENRGEFIRIVSGGSTYSISLEDFKRYAVPYFNPSYGPQLRASLRYWVYVAKKAKRNARRDNPVIQTSEPFTQRPQSSWRNLDLFSR